VIQHFCVPGKSHDKVAEILDGDNIMHGTHITTIPGHDLGKMVDLYFDEATGAIKGL
jgi:uncharacterized protein YrrD